MIDAWADGGEEEDDQADGGGAHRGRYTSTSASPHLRENEKDWKRDSYKDRQESVRQI